MELVPAALQGVAQRLVLLGAGRQPGPLLPQGLQLRPALLQPGRAAGQGLPQRLVLLLLVCRGEEGVRSGCV